MVYQNLVNQIKTEARIRQDNSFDSTVIGLINELFKEAVESQRPFELRSEQPLNLTTATATVALPTDFFIHHQVFFKDVDTGKKWQLTDFDKAIPPAPRGFYGHPTGFQVASGNLVVLPKEDIVSGDQIILVYYKKPPEISEIDLVNSNPIPRLEPFIIRGVLRRLRMLHSDDLQVAQMLSGDISSAAQAYTKDSPERDAKSGS
jgi:hypothetical protein